MSEDPPTNPAEDAETTTEERRGLTREEADNLWERTLDH
jgi:hypothetical protein